MTRKKSIFLVILISSVIVGLLYRDVLSHLNSYLFSVRADGLPNYYTYLYHIKHDPSYFAFSGMNYPYGESLFMVDCHPLFSNCIKFFSKHVLDISAYSIGILNFVMLASLVVCALFVFLILDVYRFKWYIALPAAVSIALLASNALLWRYGHYALSYSCFFPISWYLILRYFSSTHKIKYSILIFFNTLFWFYTHNYLGFIVLSFTFLSLFYSLLFRIIRFNRQTILSFFIQILLPALIVFTVIKITDTHTNRISMPYNSDYRASAYSVFFPYYSYLKPVYAFFFDLSPQQSQSWCYVGNYIGLSTNLILLSTLIYLLFKLISKRQWMLPGLLSKSELVFLLAATTLLLYAMAIPFMYGMDYLLPVPVKQFSAIGRFAWPFYFVSIVTSLLFVRSMLKKQAAIAISLLAVALLFSESLSYHLALRKEIVQDANIFKADANLVDAASSHINFLDYQAIIPIPFYHVYISLNAFESSDRSQEVSMQLSYQSGLPLVSAILSRPSVLESKNIVQLFIPAYYNKPIQHSLNEKPFLILFTKEKHTPLEQSLIDKSQKIFENYDIELYKLPKDSLFKTNNKRYLQEFTDHQGDFRLDKESGYYIKDSGRVYYNSFDSLKSKECYRGKGALFKKKNQLNVIYKSLPNQFDKDVEYSLSFWYYSYDYEQSYNPVWLEVKDSANRVISSTYIDPIKSNLYDGNWAYNEILFKLNSKNSHIELYSKGYAQYSDSTYYDELLIRPSGKNIFKPLGKIILRNNEAIAN